MDRKDAQKLKMAALRIFAPMIAIAGFVLSSPAQANAADFTVLATVPAIVDQLILLMAILAIALAFKVYTLVRGGLLAPSWRFFVVGCLCLAIAQCFQLAGTVGLFEAPELLKPASLFVMVFLWFLGALRAKKALG